MGHWSVQPTAVEAAAVRSANTEIIRRVVEGFGIDSGSTNDHGVHIVFNTACAHIPSILRDGYKNRADLERERGVVGSPHSRRTLVDTAVAAVCGTSPDALYYAALELAGAGMRYYGDICLVLTREAQGADQNLLYRNSYDLEREPLHSQVGGSVAGRLVAAFDLMGDWTDAAAMVERKIIDNGDMPPGRLLTAAGVQRGVIDDEDYIEVPRGSSFSRSDIAEARTTAADATVQTRLAVEHAVTPSIEQMKWLAARQRAERALEGQGVAVRIVTQAGRVR